MFRPKMSVINACKCFYMSKIKIDRKVNLNKFEERLPVYKIDVNKNNARVLLT